MAVTGKGGVRVVGAARLDASMAAFGRALSGPPMAAAVSRVGPVLARNVKAKTPRRTGRLAASVRVVPAAGAEGGRLSVAVSASASHAPAVEFGVGPRPGLRGGHNVRARRMLAKGLDTTRPAATDTAAATVQAAARRVKGA